MSWIDRLDNVLTQARGNGKARREAARFERNCQEGVPYYSIEECVQPWGNEPRAMKWVFKRGRLGGLSCGPHSPAYVWLNYGPLMEDPGDHIEELLAPSTNAHPPTAKQREQLARALCEGLERARKELTRA
ncbi:hypothetical protein [Streptomyces marispadix]|uniref:Uncharacterized protein n=1 Tax=Streptomyces marispadix TaxID=2922868 RepID=A0ABS9T0G3_9ACTN|nr:hypothetical protein [Streptomyces marispadix]MCH6162020.1 hypothetical protein [Streptomyces marispadix]